MVITTHKISTIGFMGVQNFMQKKTPNADIEVLINCGSNCIKKIMEFLLKVNLFINQYANMKLRQEAISHAQAIASIVPKYIAAITNAPTVHIEL